MYGGKWLVIRVSDRRIMTESYSIYECVRWIETCGGTEKRGRELAPRFIERMRANFPDFLA